MHLTMNNHQTDWNESTRKSSLLWKDHSTSDHWWCHWSSFYTNHATSEIFTKLTFVQKILPYSTINCRVKFLLNNYDLARIWSNSLGSGDYFLNLPHTTLSLLNSSLSWTVWCTMVHIVWFSSELSETMLAFERFFTYMRFCMFL